MAKNKLESGLGHLFPARTEQGKAQVAREPEKPAAVTETPELVRRDTFTFPLEDYAHLDELIVKLGRLGIPRAARSEVVRVGIHALLTMSDKQLLETFSRIKRIKTGRRKTNQ